VEIPDAMLADASLELKLSTPIVNHIVEPIRMSTQTRRKISNVGAARMKKDAGDKNGGKENS
jgi:hypothetical protein